MLSTVAEKCKTHLQFKKHIKKHFRKQIHIKKNYILVTKEIHLQLKKTKIDIFRNAVQITTQNYTVTQPKTNLQKMEREGPKGRK